MALSPPFLGATSVHLQQVPPAAAMAEAGVVGGVSEVFQSETGGFELKQLGERFGEHAAACAPAGGAGGSGGRNPRAPAQKVRLNFLSADLKCDLSDAFAREHQPKNAEGCGTLRAVVTCVTRSHPETFLRVISTQAICTSASKFLTARS
jgi:hypothetical protein